MSKVKTYYTLDNGLRAFKVVIDNKKVYVYKYKKYDENTNTTLYSEKSVKYEKKNFFKYKNIFIGKSPIHKKIGKHFGFSKLKTRIIQKRL